MQVRVLPGPRPSGVSKVQARVRDAGRALKLTLGRAPGWHTGGGEVQILASATISPAAGKPRRGFSVSRHVQETVAAAVVVIMMIMMVRWLGRSGVWSGVQPHRALRLLDLIQIVGHKSE